MTPMPVDAMPEEGWLIHKAGRGWYRPNAEGYTMFPAEAGRYSRDKAIRYSHPNGLDGPRDGMTIKHASEVQACRSSARLLSSSEIVLLCAARFDVKPLALQRERGDNEVIRARWAAMWVIRNRYVEKRTSLAQIARVMKRDISTVRYAINKAEEMRASDETFRTMTDLLLAEARQV